MKLRKNSIDKLVFCCLALLPLVLVVFRCLATGEYDLAAFENGMHDITNILWLQNLSTFIKHNLLADSANVYLNLSIDYFSYLTLLFVVDFVFYLVTFILRLVKRGCEKLGGEL